MRTDFAKEFLLAAAIILMVVAAAPAKAGSPLYLTGRLGATSLEADLTDSFQQVLDGEDNSWSLGLGVQFGKHLAFQAEYIDLGSVALAAGCLEVDLCLVAASEVGSTAVAVTVLPRWPLTKLVSVYGKIGIVSWDTDISAVSGVGSRLSDLEGEDLVYGAGLRFGILGPLGAYVELERLGDTFETVAVGATFGF